MAGLVCYYNTRHYHYLHIRGDDYDSCDRRKYLTITCCDNAQLSEPVGEGIDITGANTLWLRADFNGPELQFFYALTEGDWLPVGPILDGSILSDDYVAHTESGFEPCFTGAFFAICCQDLSGHNATADFAWFDYREMTTQPAPGLIP
jgi:xylan 1,4-beta-xylosidase